jgi:signal transduction histidine kinase
MELSLIIKLVVFFIDISGLGLILLVNVKKGGGRIAHLFTLMGFLMFIWVNFAYLARVLPPAKGLFLIKAAWAITPLFFVTIYFFISALLERRRNHSAIKTVLLLLGILNIPFVLFTPLVIENIWFNSAGVLEIEYGMLAVLFFMEVLALTVLNFYLLFKKRAKASQEKRKKIDYLLFGFSFFFAMNAIFNIFLPVFFKVFHLYSFGDYSTIVLLSFIAYAIVTQKLFGIKVVLTKALVVVIGVLLLGNILASGSVPEFIWSVCLFLFFLFFGFLLIRSVRREIEQREKLKAAYKKLQRIDQSKTEFISIASHQLRTPLSAIKGYLSMVLEGDFGSVPPKQEKALRKVYQSGDRLIQLVENLLNVSRISQGRMKYDLEKDDLREVVDKIVDEMSPMAKKKKVGIEYKKPKNLAAAEMDREKISEVITNLIDNAIKYTDQGKITIKLQNAHVNTEEPQVRFCITDTGMGVKKDEIKNLFKKFSRAPETSVVNTEGVGLGLYVAKKIIEDHGGEIWVESKGEGKGSKFIFELPAA